MNGSERLPRNLRPRIGFGNESDVGESWNFRLLSCPWHLLLLQARNVSDCFLGWVWGDQSIQIGFCCVTSLMLCMARVGVRFGLQSDSTIM